jgi:hypothetical protein
MLGEAPIAPDLYDFDILLDCVRSMSDSSSEGSRCLRFEFLAAKVRNENHPVEKIALFTSLERRMRL